MTQRPIQENQVADFAVRKVGDTITDADLDPNITSYTDGLLEINRTRPGGPGLVVSHSISSELQIIAASGAFQVNNLGQVNGQTINSTTILTASQKTALTGGNQSADSLHTHIIPTFFYYHGTISAGTQLQLPPGFTADDVHYTVSANHFEIDNLLSNTSFEWNVNIDENRFTTLEINQPSGGSNVAQNGILNYFITGFKVGGSQTGGEVASGAATTTQVKTAVGYWDGEATINFQTGQITIAASTISFYNSNGSLTPKFDYLGDTFDDPNFPPPKVVWTIVNENNTTYNGGISDRAYISGIGSIGGESATTATLNSLSYSGGVKSKFVATADTQFTGRVAFFAFSSAVI